MKTLTKLEKQLLIKALEGLDLASIRYLLADPRNTFVRSMPMKDDESDPLVAFTIIRDVMWDKPGRVSVKVETGITTLVVAHNCHITPVPYTNASEDNPLSFIYFVGMPSSCSRISTDTLPLTRFLTRRLGYSSDVANKVAGLCKDIAAKSDEITAGYKVEFLSGKAVTEAYEASVGAHSCMAGSCAYLTELYSNNPEHVELSVLYDKDDRSTARALVWKWEDEKKFLIDRIYFRTDMDKSLLNEMACKKMRERGYERVMLKDYDELNQLPPLHLDGASHRGVPYFDTMLISSEDNGKTVFAHPCEDMLPGELGSEDSCEGGDWLDENMCDYSPCERCGDRLHYYDLMTTEDNYQLCEYCYSNEATRAVDRHGSSVVVAGDSHYDLHYSEILDELLYCPYDHPHLVYLEYLSDYAHEDDCEYCEQTRDFYLSDDMMTIITPDGGMRVYSGLDPDIVEELKGETNECC